MTCRETGDSSRRPPPASAIRRDTGQTRLISSGARDDDVDTPTLRVRFFYTPALVVTIDPGKALMRQGLIFWYDYCDGGFTLFFGKGETMKGFSPLVILAAVAAPLLVTAPAGAVLTLTLSGISDGFSLSTFYSHPGANYDLLGSGVLANGNLAVGGFAAGALYEFADVDGQTLGSANPVASLPNIIDVASSGGKVYAASRSSGFFNVSNNLTLTPIVLNPLGPIGAQGIAVNPVNGHVISASTSGIIDIDPVTGNWRTIVANPPSIADGVSVSPDGQTVYVAIFGQTEILGYDIATGNVVFTQTGLNGGPDGTAVISGGIFAGDIISNNNDGSVILIDPSTHVVTTIATGGSRGDFASPDESNGSLLLFDADAVYRLSCGTNCAIGSGPPPLPEPMTLSLFGVGLMGIGFLRRRWR
jgi:hypothetical protein